MLGELIDLQRNLECFAAAGAQEIALPPNGRIQFPRFTGGSTAYWVGEGTAITESQPTTGNLDLQAKKLGVLVKMNNELLRFASPSAEGLVRFDMARSAALKADLAMLEGTGGTQIKGLATYTGITTHTASTTGTNGDTFQPEDVAKMEAKLPDAVDAPTAWVMRKSLFAALLNRRSDAVTAADGKGGFLFRDNRSVGTDRPRELYGTPVVRSSQVSGTRTKGSGTNADVPGARVLPGLDRGAAGGDGVPGQRRRRHRAGERPDVAPRHPAHRRRPPQPGQLRPVRPTVAAVRSDGRGQTTSVFGC